MVQVTFPEVLLTSLFPTLLLLGIYIDFENPSLRKVTIQRDEMVNGFAAIGGGLILHSFRDISNADFRQITYEVARFHHEKYNGSGSDFDPNIVRIFLDAKREVIALMQAHPEQAE